MQVGKSSRQIRPQISLQPALSGEVIAGKSASGFPAATSGMVAA
jgi:hypothetical protein